MQGVETIREFIASAAVTLILDFPFLLTLVPKGEQLFADVEIKNDDVGFVQVGQSAHVKLASYPFQKYGMLTGKVIRISADASEVKPATNQSTSTGSQSNSESNPLTNVSTYKVRVKLDQQALSGPNGSALVITPGMQAVAEINQGKRTVLEYLLSPVQKAVQEAGRER
ncbi:HlyD family secretion protein [Herminiimonas aquatilis]|uniref:HlyD family secretion protein n=1 Tax=Herminiimonas aquatilis TaxID=345342 RepID=A0ABW2J7Q5_9BURK